MTHVTCPSCQAVNRIPEDRLAADWRQAKCPKCGTPLFPGKPVDATGEALHRAIESAIARKPKGHDFIIDRATQTPAVGRHMSVTGG